MDLEDLTGLQIVAANLALVVALVHLGLGVLNWVKWLSAGFLVPRDVRWPLFVLSGLALLVAMPFALRDEWRRPLYAGGVGLMLAYVWGYFAWHIGGHRPLLFVGPGTQHCQDPTSPGCDPVPLATLVVDHVFAGPVEFLALSAEVGLLVLLVYFLATE